MKVMYNKIKLSALVLFSVTCFVSANAQQGRLPTQAELDAKMALQTLYASSSSAKAAPTHLATTGPEQDCDNAIPVCQQTYSQANSYTGHGSSQEVSGTCLSSQETNSVWYVFTVQNSGTFTFLLNTANDYDFALYDITTIGCTGVPSATPARCNYSATYGSTGLTLPASSTVPLAVSASGSPTMPGMNVTAGQTFVLIIDNYSANSNGYTITFGGTAQIYDVNPPTLTTSNFPCGGNYININFSEPVTCASIAANGTDFTITGPGAINVPVTSEVGNLCSTGASNTNYVTVNFNNTGLPSGTYTVHVANGTDGNSILDKCGNAMSTSQNVTFTYLAPITISATNTTVCAGGPSTLTVSGAGSAPGITYSWAPITASTSSVVVNPTANTTYIATVSSGGCTRSASQTISVSLPPVVSVNPSNISLCSGTTNIIASASIGSTPCASCNYTWTGSSTQVDNAVPSSTITNAGPGSYSVTVSSGNGCPGNTAVSNVSIISPASTPACNIVYASPAGGGSGLTPGAPTTIQNALTLSACNSVVIKMQIGDYTITNPLVISSYVTIEGGYNVGFTTKTSAKATTGGFPAQGTRIIRSAVNVEGTVPSQRYTGISITASSSYFRIQDVRVDMPDNAAGTGISNYGIYLGSGCHDYNITRCYIYSGNAGSGIAGGTGANGLTGSAGSGAANGGTGSGAPKGNSGGGGTGGGAGGGAGASGLTYSSGAALAGSTGAAGGTSRDGSGGASGGSGAFSASGSIGGGTGGGGTAAGGGVANTSSGCGFSAATSNGANGAAGAAGANATVAGAAGAAGSDAVGFWVPVQAGSGANGNGGAGGKGGGGGGAGINPSQTSGCGPSYGTSAGGAGGGGGGQGGAGGLGGYGGGSTYGIFIFSNGANGTVADCQIFNGTAGAGGVGGVGGTGGAGGAGGVSASNATVGGCANSCSSVLAGNGGKGGAGGAGGSGAAGGTGAAGIAVPVKVVGGSALAVNSTINMLTQPVITVDNLACTNINIAHSTAAAAPVWSSFGTTASPASGSGSPASTMYSGQGRKTVVMNANNYTDFNNIIVNAPPTGSIVASAAAICPGSANFASTAIGTAGLTYSWSALPAGATIGTASTSSTSITFPNTGSTPITYTVTLNITSQCCGLLTPVTMTIVVNPIPSAPVATANSVCVGGIATYTATAPAGASFSWYNAAASGTLLATGTTYSVPNVSTTSTVYVQATNSGGCTSSLTPVVVTPTVVPPPTVIPGSSCDPGLVQVSINPVPGITNYDWYSNAAGTSFVQSGSSLDYSQNIASAGGTYTVYVQSDIPGCAPSVLVPVSGSVSATPITLVPTITPNDTVCVNTAVTISLSPGGGNGTYSYTWSPVTSTLSTITQTVPASTAYNVLISSGGCSKQFNIPILVKPYPKDTIAPPASITCLTSSVTLNGSFSASGPGYTYTWTTGSGTIISAANVNTITVSAGGTYSLMVTDLSTGCTSTQTVAVNVTTTPPVAQVAATASISCLSPTVALNGSGSSTGSTITYSWTAGGGGTISSGANASTAATGTAGTYVLTVTDTNTGCSATATATVTGNTTTPNLSVSNTSIPCGAASTTVSASSTNTNVTYSWSGASPGSVLSGSNTGTPSVGNAGSYTVVATDPQNGCTTTSVVTVAQSTINAAFTADPTSGVSPLAVNFTNQSTGATGYSWTFGDPAGGTSTAVNPSNTYSTTGSYTVMMVATAGTCKDTAYAVIVVENGLTLEIPNVFTPNGDNINDVFSIKSTGVKEIDLQIFNRWGEKLYDFSGPMAAWDGRSGEGAKVPDGTYFFFVKATGFDSKTIEKKGTVNLYR